RPVPRRPGTPDLAAGAGFRRDLRWRRGDARGAGPETAPGRPPAGFGGAMMAPDERATRRRGAARASSGDDGRAGSVVSQVGRQEGSVQSPPRPGASAWVALTLATFSMVVGFAVWSLLAPLAPLF